jgi:hypothetical protein
MDSALGNSFDSEFFRKLYLPPNDEPSWRRQAGAALRSPTTEASLPNRDGNSASVRAKTQIETGNAGSTDSENATRTKPRRKSKTREIAAETADSE